MNLKISHKIAALMGLLLILASLVSSTTLYFEKRSALLGGVDEKLLGAARFAQHLVGHDYHDRIIDADSIAEDDYLALIDEYNQLCESDGLQYLWSLMLVDGEVVFTTSTSTSHNVKNGDHALFFDRHTNPAIYSEAFATQQIQHSSFQDKWGEGRMVLIPGRDAHDRPFLFAASVSTSEVDSLLAQTMRRSLGIGLVILLLGLGVGILLARTLSKPLVQLAETTSAIAHGDLGQQVALGGSTEIASLASSINHMSSSISEQVTASQEGERRYKELTDLLPEIVFEVDLTGHITYANRAAFTKFGYSREELGQGLVLHDMIVPDDRERAARNIAQIIGGEKQGGNEYRAQTRDGAIFPVIIHSTPIIREGAPVGLRGIVIDITERRRLEEEVRRAHNLESLGLLAGGIAHDFNNILTGITGNLGLLRMRLGEDSEASSIITEAQLAADRTRSLTGQLITFAKGGAPSQVTASIEGVIREATSLSLHGSNTRSEYHFPRDLRSALIDTAQIGQVVQNLVLNADQAMPDGGILKISAQNVEISEGDPLPLSPGWYVRASLEDQGAGIPQDILPRVFDPYFTTKPTGHGLGLSISHSIVSRHAGHITVRSVAGEGTTFEFYLPASETAAEPMAEQQGDIPRGTGRILLMDDEPIFRSTVGKMLEALGYEVENAGDGTEALQTYQDSMSQGNPFDVVIMDLTIPGGMGGEAAVARLHQIDPQARAIVASGYAADPVMTNFADYGFSGRVPKPVGMRELADTVRTVLSGP